MIERRPLWLTLVYSVLALALAALAVGPALWLLYVSLRPSSDPMYALRLDGNFTPRHFVSAWYYGKDPASAPPGSPTLLVPLLNSLLITLGRATLNVLLAAMAAYPLAKMKFRGRDTIFVLILATMMIPDQVIVVPMFRIVASMGLFDSLMAVVLPFSVSAFGIYLCRQAFIAIPDELEEAARIDGAGSGRIWWHVMLPLAGPTLSTLFLFSVIGAWSELLWPLIVLQNQGNYTLPVALNQLLGQFASNLRPAYAGAVMALGPILVLFVLAQRFLKAELFAGSVKG
jgi:putative chitobiose transport system permease protein